jgi:prepilin peptidase CpaA
MIRLAIGPQRDFTQRMISMFVKQETIDRFDGTNAVFRECSQSLMALSVSALVTTCFVWSAAETPLPCTIGAAAFLAVASFTDVRWMKIPNMLTLPALFLAFAYGFAEGGGLGLVQAFKGAGLAILLFGAGFACGWMGAGDVKAAMVLGAIWGPSNFAHAAWWMILVGGVLAIAILVAHPRALFDLVKRWSRSLWYSIQLGRPTYLPPHANSEAKGLPFAVAMGLGAACVQVWGSPWA